jgi:ribosome biogenesis ATPase
LYVPLPTPDDRASILKALSANVNLSSDVNVEELAKSKRADGFSGADCAAMLREAGLAVLRDHALDRIRRRENNNTDHDDKKPLQITRKHFDYAFDHVMPSVSKADQKKYDKMRDQMARARSRSRASLNTEKEEDGDSTVNGTFRNDSNQENTAS